MPELPEVETIRRSLNKKVQGRIVVGVSAGTHRGFQFSELELRQTVEGQRIDELRRRGKYLVFALGQCFCIFHLGMTGQLTIRDPQREDSKKFLRHPLTGLQRARQHPADQHTHLELLLDDGKSILFRDVRKFGKVVLRPRSEEALDAFFAHLGMEPFSPDYQWTSFLEQLKGRKTRVKSLLLDQSVVAGVGNIYADEALFEAGIHPARRVHRLRKYEMLELFHSITLVLERGIQFGGTSFRDFLDSNGQKGSYQEKLNVYGRRGKACRNCGSLVDKTVVSQRGTHFCPVCQPRSGPRRTAQKLP